jgi:hypothetical protein
MAMKLALRGTSEIRVLSIRNYIENSLGFSDTPQLAAG